MILKNLVCTSSNAPFLVQYRLPLLCYIGFGSGSKPQCFNVAYIGFLHLQKEKCSVVDDNFEAN